MPESLQLDSLRVETRQLQPIGSQAVTSCLSRIFLDASRMVTSSSAAVGWMPTTESSCFFVAPSFRATAMPCKHQRSLRTTFMANPVVDTG